MKYLTIVLLGFIAISCIENTNRQKKNSASIFVPPKKIINIESQTCNACAFLDINFFGEKLLYNTPNGKVISKLHNDTINNSFVMFTILNTNDSMFYVEAYQEDGSSNIKGWINKENVCVYSNLYNIPVLLYSKPDTTSEINNKIDGKGSTIYYYVIDCKENWLKVKCFFNGKKYKGWLPPNRQCCLVFTTCS